jgi:electron transfer flavoprotein-quinone oxidoreductase
MAMGVKEVIKLPKNVLEERFGLGAGTKNGAAKQFFGGLKGEENGHSPFAMGFLYTFKNHISIGLGVALDDLTFFKTTPYELLERLKNHPTIAPLLEGGEVAEYSAHLIPEGGYKNLPKLYCAGAMLVGDAAGFLNPLQFEGTNLAITSGKFAGETALLALERGKFTENVLKIYKKKLDSSYVIKDLKNYRNLVDMAKDRAESIFGYYPKMADEFFTMFTTAAGVPKREGYRAFVKKFFGGRKISELFKDCYQFAKSGFEVIK